METLMGIVVLILTIVNFIIYHKYIRVIYFGNMSKAMVGELTVCLIVALIEVGVVKTIGGTIFEILLKILPIILLVLLVVFIVNLFRKK